MTDLQLKLGVYRYEHTEPLFDGRVAIDSADVALETAPLISDVFHRMARHELDISEFGLTYFLRTSTLMIHPSWRCRSSRTATSGTRRCS